MKFVFRHKLSHEATVDLLHLHQELLPKPNLLPLSKFKFLKLFEQISIEANSSKLVLKPYCTVCKCLLKEQTPGSNTNFACSTPKCDFSQSIEDLKITGNFFYYYPLIGQLRELFKNHKLFQMILENCNRKHSISQIVNELSTSVGTVEYINLCLNWDGVKLFRSSRWDIWPIQIALQDLPYALRIRNILIPCLWSGVGKPPHCILDPLIEELQIFAKFGIDLPECQKIFKVFVTTCACDSIARAMIQCVHQFNGKYGCNWCLNEGSVIEDEGGGHSNCYLNVPAADRTHNSTKDIADEVLKMSEKDSKLGIVGKSRLFFLPKFDIIRGFSFDTLHTLHLGVTGHLLRLYTLKKFKSREFYIGDKTELIEDRLSCIKIPFEFPRKLRSLSDIEFFKANEFRMFIILGYYIFDEILKSKFLDHFCILTLLQFLGNKENYCPTDISFLQTICERFVRDMETFYEAQSMRYNVHQILHLPFSIINHGPLAEYSTYLFENFNGILRNLLHGTRNISLEIMGRYMSLR